MGQAESKAEGAAVGGSVGAAAIGGGIALMFAGPVGWAVGGMLIGTGVSSTVNTIDQCVNNKGDTFDYGAWGKNVGVGAATGVIAAPFAAVGGAAAAGVSSTVGKVATVVAAETVGGAVSGGSGNLISKAANGEDVSAGDFFKGAAVGAAAGAVGGLAGQGAQRGASALTKGVTKGAGKAAGKALKVTTGMVGGAAGGAGGAAIGKIVENSIFKGELKEKSFLKMMEDGGADLEDAKALWSFLCSNGVIEDEEVKMKVPSSLQFPENLECYEKPIRSLIEKIHDASITDGVGDAAVGGLIMGGVMGGISAAAEIQQQKKAARRQRNRVMRKSRLERASGKPQTGEKGVGSAVTKSANDRSKVLGPASKGNAPLQDLDGFPSRNRGQPVGEERKCRLLGGGKEQRRKVRITPNDRKRAIESITKKNPSLKKSAERAIKDLERLSVKELHQMQHNTTKVGSAKKGQHNTHTLGGRLEKLVSVDVQPHGKDRQRGAARLVFDTTRSSRIEFHDSTTTHDYKSMAGSRRS